ncbi:hypothetical protein AURDEDRAFT_173523 [Auricularia subglabra TFB-10046 SS5]|nr:hypothetical protein AURDEDRAFT_173523 [Auricularia subglabra TFB-10046 SS5]
MDPVPEQQRVTPEVQSLRRGYKSGRGELGLDISTPPGTFLLFPSYHHHRQQVVSAALPPSAPRLRAHPRPTPRSPLPQRCSPPLIRSFSIVQPVSDIVSSSAEPSRLPMLVPTRSQIGHLGPASGPPAHAESILASWFGSPGSFETCTASVWPAGALTARTAIDTRRPLAVTTVAVNSGTRPMLVAGPSSARAPTLTRGDHEAIIIRRTHTPMAEPAIAQAFAALRAATDDAARADAARLLADQVEAAAGEGAASGVIDDALNWQLLDLLHAHPLAGLAAIDALVHLDKRSLYRYWNGVAPLFQAAGTPLPVMRAAAHIAAAIVRAGGAGFGEHFVDQEVPGAADLLTVPVRNGLERYAGVLLLTVMARHLPAPFSKHVDVVLEKLQAPLRDPRVFVREAAADLLALYLDLLLRRREPLLARVLEQAKIGLQSGQADIVHGSLLMHAALLLHAKMFMRDSIVETASAIVRFAHHKHHSPLVLHTALALVPVLAEYDTQTFVEHYVAPSMDQLVAHLAVPADRDVAFSAIGRLAHAVGSEVRLFLDRIVNHVRVALQASAHNYANPYPVTPALTLNRIRARTMLQAANAAALKLALEILGSFEFSEHTLTEFVRDACLPYMAHSAGDVRLAATRTCAALLLRDATVYHMSQHAIGIVHEVIVVHTVAAMEVVLPKLGCSSDQ